MLPFSGIDFFILAGALTGILFLFKALFSKQIAFRHALLFVTVAYLALYFPGVQFAAAFVVYCYTIYYVFVYVLKLKQRWPGVVLLLLPMLLVKSSIAVDWISFAGLSYVTFRVLQIYLDADANTRSVRIDDYILFTLFPATILIGPIDRYPRFAGDLNNGYAQLSGDRFQSGLEQLMLGVLQKFVIVEFINRYGLAALDPEDKSATAVLGNMYVYSFYLYFDFAGYSSLACGLGKMMGINVPENFNIPFLAVNPKDFWRRWHITLSEWLTDYLFRPYYKWISGKKSMKNYPLLKQNLGLFLVFFVMGLWNGFQLNFMLSGTVFGIYSVVHNSYVYQSKKRGRDIVFGNLNETAVKWISIFLMFNFACIALYIFSGRCPWL